MQSILGETPKLILARRLARRWLKLGRECHNCPLEQSKQVLRYVLAYLEGHPEMDLQLGLPEVVSESFP